MTTSQAVRTAVIQGGFVVNVIVARPGFVLAGHTLVASETAQVGWHWNGSSFTPGVLVVIPEFVTSRQFKLALLAADLLATVEAAVAADDDEAVRITWAEMTVAYRNDVMLNAMAAQLRMASDDVDALFVAAAAIS